MRTSIASGEHPDETVSAEPRRCAGGGGVGLEFLVLGPLSVVREGSELDLGARRVRLVLALLLLEAGRVVPADSLVDRIWGAATPRTGTGPLRTYIWQLRRLLGTGGDDGPDAGDGTLRSRRAGYALDVDPTRIDGVCFERRFAQARATAAAGRLEDALAQVEAALALWRAPAFGDLALETTIQSEARRLDQLRLEARELHAELLLAVGDHARVATELQALVDAHPHRERLWALLLTALYRSGRQADALRCYQEARRGLVETAGLEPGPELRDLEQAILRQDPALHAPALDRHDLPGRSTSRVGRETELVAVVDAVAQGLSRLVRTSMVDAVPPGDGPLRYRLLETVRQYALERLREPADADGVIVQAGQASTSSSWSSR